MGYHHIAACTPPHSCLHTTKQPLAHHHIAACTLHPITPDCCFQAQTRQPLAHYHAATCTPHPINFKHEGDLTQRLKVTQYDPLYLLSTKNRWTGHEVVHYVQGEHNQTYLLQTPLSKCQHPGWTNSVQDGPKVSHLSHIDKDMVEQSHTTP